MVDFSISLFLKCSYINLFKVKLSIDTDLYFIENHQGKVIN